MSRKLVFRTIGDKGPSGTLEQTNVFLENHHKLVVICLKTTDDRFEPLDVQESFQPLINALTEENPNRKILVAVLGQNDSFDVYEEA